MKSIDIEISPGELIDRITILELKAGHAPNDQAMARINGELALLRAVEAKLSAPLELPPLRDELGSVNRELWHAEDQVRAWIIAADDRQIAATARLICALNDRRMSLKKRINDLFGTGDCGQKVYASPA